MPFAPLTLPPQLGYDRRNAGQRCFACGMPRTEGVAFSPFVRVMDCVARWRQ